MTEQRYYAGIGSRKTPAHILDCMEVISMQLYDRGYWLRSGGAIGADQAFEKCAGSRAEIFLPTKDYPMWTEVFTMHFHPNPAALSVVGWQLMCRNAMQILGRDGNTPVDFVVCWTKDGKASGGTGQAIRIAKEFDIPVYNLYNNNEVSQLANRIVNTPKVA